MRRNEVELPSPTPPVVVALQERPGVGHGARHARRSIGRGQEEVWREALWELLWKLKRAPGDPAREGDIGGLEIALVSVGLIRPFLGRCHLPIICRF